MIGARVTSGSLTGGQASRRCRVFLGEAQPVASVTLTIAGSDALDDRPRARLLASGALAKTAPTAPTPAPPHEVGAPAAPPCRRATTPSSPSLGTYQVWMRFSCQGQCQPKSSSWRLSTFPSPAHQELRRKAELWWARGSTGPTRPSPLLFSQLCAASRCPGPGRGRRRGPGRRARAPGPRSVDEAAANLDIWPLEPGGPPICRPAGFVSGSAAGCGAGGAEVDDIRIISARPATRAARRTYEEKSKRTQAAESIQVPRSCLGICETIVCDVPFRCDVP